MLCEFDKKKIVSYHLSEFNLFFFPGKMTMKEVVELFDSDVMKQLKNECGGLKTLLKNANQVFEGKSSPFHQSMLSL